MIAYCENILRTDLLRAENLQSFTIIIHDQDKTLIIPYQGKGAGRDTTLTVLNQILQPNYEISFCEAWDTLEFYLYPVSLWQKLEQKYTNKMN